MKRLIIIVTFVQLVFPPTTETFVVTKFDSPILETYFNLVESHASTGQAMRWFRRRNLFENCHMLRQSRMFHPADEDADEELPTISEHLISEEALRTENNRIAIHRRKLRVQGQDHWMLSFNCLDLEGLPRWFLSPSSITDSAFLSVAEGDFEYVHARQTGHALIAPLLTAIVDMRAVVLPNKLITGNFEEVIYKSIKAANYSEKDPLCDLNYVLKCRLCVLVADARRTFELHKFKDTNITSWLYKNRTHNIYYQQEHADNNCPPLTMRASGYEAKRVTRKYLHCSVQIPEIGTRDSFYLLLNMMNPARVIVYTQTMLFQDLWTTSYQEVYVPLLEHYEKQYSPLYTT